MKKIISMNINSGSYLTTREVHEQMDALAKKCGTWAAFFTMAAFVLGFVLGLWVRA